MNFIEELQNATTKEIEVVKKLVVNTIKAKAFYKRGGWSLVKKELGNEYCNPNFSMTYLTLHHKLKDLGKDVEISIKSNLGRIEREINKELGVKAIEYYVNRKNHALKIIL